MWQGCPLLAARTPPDRLGLARTGLAEGVLFTLLFLVLAVPLSVPQRREACPRVQRPVIPGFWFSVGTVAVADSSWSARAVKRIVPGVLPALRIARHRP